MTDPFRYNDAQVEAITQLLTAKNYSFAYQLAAQYADTQPGADQASVAWLRGAAEVNANQGGNFNNFIRSYTKAQFQQRYGQELSDAQLQSASDRIADRVLGIIVSQGVLPSINDIAGIDFTVTANLIFNGDAAAWAVNRAVPRTGYRHIF